MVKEEKLAKKLLKKNHLRKNLKNQVRKLKDLKENQAKKDLRNLLKNQAKNHLKEKEEKEAKN